MIPPPPSPSDPTRRTDGPTTTTMTGDGTDGRPATARNSQSAFSSSLPISSPAVCHSPATLLLSSSSSSPPVSPMLRRSTQWRGCRSEPIHAPYRAGRFFFLFWPALGGGGRSVGRFCPSIWIRGDKRERGRAREVIGGGGGGRTIAVHIYLQRAQRIQRVYIHGRYMVLAC